MGEDASNMAVQAKGKNVVKNLWCIDAQRLRQSRRTREESNLQNRRLVLVMQGPLLQQRIEAEKPPWLVRMAAPILSRWSNKGMIKQQLYNLLLETIAIFPGALHWRLQRIYHKMGIFSRIEFLLEDNLPWNETLYGFETTGSFLGPAEEIADPWDGF